MAKQEQVISKNAKNSFNPMVPSFTKNINWNDDIIAETGGTWSSAYTEKVESPYYFINILDYANSWNDFKNKYSRIRIDYEGYVDHSEADIHQYNSYHYINLSQISGMAKTSQIFHHYEGYTQKEGKEWAEVRYQLENNKLKIDFLVYAYAGNGWNSYYTWTKTWLKVNNIGIGSKFNFNEMKNNLNRELTKPINYYSNSHNAPKFPKIEMKLKHKWIAKSEKH